MGEKIKKCFKSAYSPAVRIVTQDGHGITPEDNNLYIQLLFVKKVSTVSIPDNTNVNA